MEDKNSLWLIAASIAVLLFTGLIISVLQLQQNQDPRTRAENASTTLVDCSVNPTAITISQNEQDLLNLINQYRQQYGLKSLSWSDGLVRAATWLSEDMLSKNYLSHTDSLGRNPAVRIDNCGYKNASTSVENIDSGSGDSAFTFESWKHSPSHNNNLLNPEVNEVGIALSADPDKNAYFWTINLATRNASPSSTPTPASPTPSPTGSLTPGVTISPSPVPSATPVISITPTRIPSPTGVPQIIYPKLTKVDPDIAYVGSKVTVIGSGGYLKYPDGMIDESNRLFALKFDNQDIGSIHCYVNRCQSEITIPSVSKGTHSISVTGGSKINITIAERVPTTNPTATPTLVPTIPPDYIQNPLDTQVFISAKVIGIGQGGNLRPKLNTRKATVRIYSVDNKLKTTGYGFITYDGQNMFRGVIHLGELPNGKYYIKITAENMLQTTVQPIFQELSSARLNYIPDVTLLQGDINSDNQVNIVDYNIALPCFQNKRCEDYKLIDFNDDNVANVIDYNILLQVFWEKIGD